MTAEHIRLNDSQEGKVRWKKWGPYLSERQWGTVREDYSEGGDAWNHFTHDHARSRAYRWGEDGLGGISDDKQRLCFALALWNGKDPILKERLFGLTNSEGNHGEDVKEYYFYLDNTPTHAYMKYLYKYPQAAYPYADLVETNRRRKRITGPDKCERLIGRVAVLLLLLLLCPAVWAQIVTPKPATTEPLPEPPKDTLGRGTPRGTVLGLLNAARKGNAEIAALYLNTSLRGADAETLALQLAIVIDRRLPARLNEISDKPEGSRPNPLKPDEDLVGTIETANGELDIRVERVDRGKAGKVWLFSRKTLASIPDVYEELSPPVFERILPQFMVTTRVAQIPIFEWLALVVGTPLLYLLTGLLNRIIGLAAGALRRHLHRNTDLQNPQVLPPPIRLFLLAFAIRLLVARAHLPLLARQFWSTTALIITLVACMWLLLFVNGWGERYLVGRRRSMSGSASVLRLARRVIDGVVLFGGLLLTLSYFGINVTAALAGLGVGGIAVALAAQKTLENVIAGISLIADQAVRVGDTLNLGDVQGTVEEVGLRSTRIRTADRTVVSLPNGQIANMKVETVSARDRFLFHPVVGLRYETTPVQMRFVMADARKLLSEHPSVDSLSVRVRFVRLGTCSLDVDIFAYVFAREWNDFLGIQEELLLGTMDIIDKAGARIAFPSQTLYLAETSDKLDQPNSEDGTQRKANVLP